MQTIQSSDLRVHGRRILEQTRHKSISFLVMHYTDPAAVLMPVEEYARLTGMDLDAMIERRKSPAGVSRAIERN